MSGVWTWKRVALDAGACREIRERFERAHELGTAIGIAGVVERVHANDDVVGAEHFGPAERERQEDRVARGHVRRRNVGRRKIAIARDVDIRRQRRSAEWRAESTVSSWWRTTPSAVATARADVHFARVPLAVMNRERVQREAVGLRDGGGRIRIETAAETARPPCYHTPRVAGCQMNLWSCSWTRTARRSASTHSESSLRSRARRGRAKTESRRRWPASFAARRRRARTRSRRDRDDELHLVVRGQPIRGCSTRSSSASPLPGHFTSTTLTTARRHAIDEAMAAGLEHHGLAALRAAAPSTDTPRPAAAARRR